MKRWLRTGVLVAALLAGAYWHWGPGTVAANRSAAGFVLPTAAQMEGIRAEKGIRVDQAELKSMPVAPVVRVVDGDTVVLQVGSKQLKVRLLNINTPETVDPRRPVQTYGREASDFVKALLPPGTRLRYRYDVERRDRYGRDLVHLYLEDGTWVNALLIRAGYAQLMTVAPNVTAADFFKRLQAEARSEAVGLWQAPEYNTTRSK